LIIFDYLIFTVWEFLDYSKIDFYSIDFLAILDMDLLYIIALNKFKQNKTNLLEYLNKFKFITQIEVTYDQIFS
jgi:hypothetical protein